MKTKDKIKEYFKEHRLKVLDQNKEEIKTYLSDNLYEAVTAKYIHKYVLKEKVSFKFTCKKIGELLQENIIGVVPCNYANDIVFCNKKYLNTRAVVKFIFKNGEVDFGFEHYYRNSTFWTEKVNNFNSQLINERIQQSTLRSKE